MADVIELVEKATEKGTFSVLDAAKGTAYPEDSVVVYTDAAAAYELTKLEIEAGDETDNKRVDEIDARIAELKEQIKETSLRFFLRGYSPKIVTAINDEARAKFDTEDTTEGESADWCNKKYVAEAIQRVENTKGEVDSHLWSVEDVHVLRENLPDGEFDKISVLTANLIFVAGYFDHAVDADF